MLCEILQNLKNIKFSNFKIFCYFCISYIKRKMKQTEEIMNDAIDDAMEDEGDEEERYLYNY